MLKKALKQKFKWLALIEAKLNFLWKKLFEKISRNDLASVAGIATETLIRTMSSFKKQGLIEIEGRTIRILDLEKLKEIC